MGLMSDPDHLVALAGHLDGEGQTDLAERDDSYLHEGLWLPNWNLTMTGLD